MVNGRDRSIPRSLLEEISSWHIFREDRCSICDSEMEVLHGSWDNRLVSCKNECISFNNFRHNEKVPRMIGEYRIFGEYYSFYPTVMPAKKKKYLHFSECYVTNLLLRKDIERRIKYWRTNCRYIAELLERS